MSLEIQPITINRIDFQIDTEVLGKFWLTRLVRGFQACGEKRGRCYEIALVVGSIATTVLLGTVTVCSAYGAYFMFEESVLGLMDDGDVPANIGHGGEWSAQVILYIYFYLKAVHKIVREGDFAKIEKVYANSLQSKKRFDFEAVQSEIEKTLQIFGTNCFLPKKIYSIKLASFNILESAIQDESYIPSIKKTVTEVYQNIQHDIDSALTLKHYLKRSWVGFKSIGRNQGRMSQLTALVTGVCVPAFLGAQAVFSFMGTAIMLDDLINEGADLSVIGHLGEWPVNGVAFTYLAALMNHWAITSHGDYEIVKNILQDAIAAHKDESYYDELLQTADEELKLLASKCMFTQYPQHFEN